jgi:hypothetical protein
MPEIESLQWEWVRPYLGISFWRGATTKWEYWVSVDEYELCFVASRFPNNPMADHASTGHLIERFPTVAEAQECVQKWHFQKSDDKVESDADRQEREATAKQMLSDLKDNFLE